MKSTKGDTGPFAEMMLPPQQEAALLTHCSHACRWSDGCLQHLYQYFVKDTNEVDKNKDQKYMLFQWDQDP